MKPVMLATDGSPTAEAATEAAIELAKLLDTELLIITVWEVSYGAVGFTVVPPNEELAKLGDDDARKVNSEAASRAEEAGVETRSMVLRGFPIEEICVAAEDVDPQMLVIGSHGWGALKRTLFGSVSTGVLHRATCPVLVVRRDPHGARSEQRALEPEVPA